MAPRPVFEGAQAEFLSDRLADFCASQDEKDVSTFMAQTYTEFFETWPEDDEKKKKKLKNQIYTWYYNKVREKGTPGATRKKQDRVLNITKGPKKSMQPYQAYYHLFKEELKPLVDEAYKDYVASVEDGKPRATLLTFGTHFVRKRFKGVTDPDIKARVEKVRLRMDEENIQGEDKNCKAREAAVKCLPRTCELAAEAIERETGWYTSILVGGRDPITGGIRCYTYHSGVDLNGKPWDDLPDWESVQGSWERFIERSFRTKIFVAPERQSTTSKAVSNTELVDESEDEFEGGSDEDIDGKARRDDTDDGSEIETQEESGKVEGSDDAYDNEFGEGFEDGYEQGDRSGSESGSDAETWEMEEWAGIPQVNDEEVEDDGETDHDGERTVSGDELVRSSEDHSIPNVNHEREPNPTTPASSRSQPLTTENIPAFFRDAAEYLVGITHHQQWFKLVTVWLRLEESLGYHTGKGRLLKGSRPDEIGYFIQNARNYKKAPSLAGGRLRQFVEEWKQWWAELQPKWRNTKDWPFERQSSTKGSWETLLLGGPNGIYLIMISLSWWVSAVTKDSQDGKDWHEALEALKEVHWVFSQLLKSMALTAPPPNHAQPKRKHSGVPQPVSKRSRYI